MALSFVRAAGGEALSDEKQIKRRDDEKDERISRQAVRESFPAGRFQIFLHGQGPYVANTALIKMAGTGMMNIMFPTPVIVWRECQHARDEADEIICST